MLQHLCKATSFEACKSSFLFFIKLVYHTTAQTLPLLDSFAYQNNLYLHEKIQAETAAKIHSPVCTAAL